MDSLLEHNRDAFMEKNGKVDFTKSYLYEGLFYLVFNDCYEAYYKSQ